ncbi:MAG: NAD(P)H-dependent oxidoreductase subunit E [Bacteroidales bacterium]|nr:NAD(P)H-dependent oxidoreductase subunit E [Bacteroidales bacterium]
MPVPLDELVNRYKKGGAESLLPLLQDIQDSFGFLNEEAILKVGQHLNLPSSKIYGIATFFDQFRFSLQGRYHIRVCRGTACHMNGSFNVLREVEKILKIKEGQTSRDGYFSLEAIGCMGACSNGPVININGDFINAVSVSAIASLIEQYRKKA